MQLMSNWNTLIIITYIKIIINEKAIHVHLKYMNYDQKHSNNISLIKINVHLECMNYDLKH